MSGDEIDFGFREPQALFISGSQKARVWTESWVAEWQFCPNCGNQSLLRFPANLPVADFYCPACSDQFELKSQKTAFGAKLANGAYAKKVERLSSASSPNLLLLRYDAATRSVRDVSVVPKHFFVPQIVEERPPLKLTARRAGWVGSNILLGKIPEVGRISIVRRGIPIPRDQVLAQWQQTMFLRHQSFEARGWLVEVMKCVDLFQSREFGIDEIYSFEDYLSGIYPGNNNVRAKIRQQLQILRDAGYLTFVARGRYRRLTGR